jgi:hypothetical protein
MLLGQGAIDDALEGAAGAVAMRRLLLGIAIPVAAEMHVGGVERVEGSP